MGCQIPPAGSAPRVCQEACRIVIISGVKTETGHSWQPGVARAVELQKQLSLKVSRAGDVAAPRLIAGVDISVDKVKGMAQAAVAVLAYPELRVVDIKVTRGRLDFPYIPGLLSFRELPLLLAACRKLAVLPDLIMVDGQGIAHPRRFGLACHLGLLLDTATIGCAKSRLCGRHEPPGDEPGSYAELVDKGEIIGAVLRTRAGVKPVYISTGHRISLENAVHWVLKCCRGYRLPQPTRLAHLAAGGSLKPERVFSAV